MARSFIARPSIILVVPCIFIVQFTIFLFHISAELFRWFVWIVTSFILYIWRWFCLVGSPLLWWLTLTLPSKFGCNGPGANESFMTLFDPTKPCRQKRSLRRQKLNYAKLLCLDAKLMILSCYMLHSSEAYLYKSPIDMHTRKCLTDSCHKYST